MKLDTAAILEKFDEAAFNEGVLDGKEENLIAGCLLEAHEGMGEDYCAGFTFAMMSVQAFDAGYKAGKHRQVCCSHLVEGGDPDLAHEWMEGFWTSFSGPDCRGFSA